MNKRVSKNRRLRKLILKGQILMVLISLPVFEGLADQSLNPTPAASEGPYWKPGSPVREVLYQKGDSGLKIEVSGKVVDTSGRSIPGATIDIWQTDAQGNYDNSGYNYRGHVVTDNQGEYYFRTVKPGEYPYRTAHIHIKISTPDGRNLTTQLYFPELAQRNNRDRLFHEELNVQWRSDTKAVYNFVLR